MGATHSMDDSDTRRLAFRARWARGLALAYMAVTALNLMATAFLRWRWFSYPGLGEPGWLAIVSIINIILVLVTIALTVLYLMWLYRACANMAASSSVPLRFSPGWTVGSHFVPLANLVIPFLAMRQLHNRSHGEDPDFVDSSVSDVASWWACVIGGNLIQLFLLSVALINLIPRLYLMTPPALDLILIVLGPVLLMAAAWFLYRIIGAITDAQQSYAHIGSTFE